MKNSLADIVAANMQEIVNSYSHKKMFNKEAAKKLCCDCTKCGTKCFCKKKCKNCKDCCAKPVKPTKETKPSKENAKKKLVKKVADEILKLLFKASEIQDDIGFTKSAGLTTILINKTIRDLKKIAAASDEVADEIFEKYPEIAANLKFVESEGVDSSAPFGNDIPVVEELVHDPNAETIKADKLEYPATDIEGLGENETDTLIEATKPSVIVDQPNTIKPLPGDDLIFPKYQKPLTEEDFHLAAGVVVKMLLKASELQDSIGLTSASIMTGKIAQATFEEDIGPVSIRGNKISVDDYKLPLNSTDLDSVENEGVSSVGKELLLDIGPDTKTPEELVAELKLEAIRNYRGGKIDIDELEQEINRINNMSLGDQEVLPQTSRSIFDSSGLGGDSEDTLPADDFIFAMNQLDNIIKKAELIDEDELPADYEPCGECGFDHVYEYIEAKEAHELAERELADRVNYDTNDSRGPKNKYVKDMLENYPDEVAELHRMNQKSRERLNFDSRNNIGDLIAGNATEPEEDLCTECFGLDSEDCQFCSSDMNEVKPNLVLSGPHKSKYNFTDDEELSDPTSYVEPDETNLCLLCDAKLDNRNEFSLCNDCMD